MGCDVRKAPGLFAPVGGAKSMAVGQAWLCLADRHKCDMYVPGRRHRARGGEAGLIRWRR